jgi:hypothetical protein
MLAEKEEFDMDLEAGRINNFVKNEFLKFLTNQHNSGTWST